MLSHFFLSLEAPDTVLQGQHNPWLVLLSVLLAIVACAAALHMAGQARSATSRAQRQLTLIPACVVLGAGIWAMHFIGMLAFQLPTQVHYDLPLTLASLLPGMLASWLALNVLERPQASIARVLLSGLFVGVGIGAMHYSGMAAMHSAAVLRYDPFWFAVSLLVAVVLAITALALHRGIAQQAQIPAWVQMAVPATVLGLAISGMHYISMAAARFICTTAPPPPDASSTDNLLLALFVALVTVVVGFVLVLGTGLMHYKRAWQRLARSEARTRTLMDTAGDGVITIDAQGLVQSFNPAAERIFGWKAGEVMGRNVGMLMPDPISDQHNGFLTQHLLTGEQHAIGQNREILGLHKDKRLVPLRLSVARAEGEDGPMFLGYVMDLSDRKRTDAQLRVAASVFDNTCEGVGIIDALFNISEINPAFTQMFGLDKAQCIGQPFEQLYEEAPQAVDFRHIWSQVRQQYRWQGELLLRRPNGERWLQRLSLTCVLNEHKRPQHYIAVVSDITPQATAPTLHKPTLDPMTGLPGEALLLEQLPIALLHAQRHAQQVAVVCVALNHLDRVLAVHGPAVCDALVHSQVQRLRGQLRTDDLLVRLSNGHLAMLMTGLHGATTLQSVLERLQAEIEAPIQAGGLQLEITTTLGGSLAPEHGLSGFALLRQAQDALAHARECGTPFVPAANRF